MVYEQFAKNKKKRNRKKIKRSVHCLENVQTNWKLDNLYFFAMNEQILTQFS